MQSMNPLPPRWLSPLSIAALGAFCSAAPLQAIEVFRAAFGTASNLNPADLPAALNAVTATGTWSDFIQTVSVSPYGLEDNASADNAALVLDRVSSGSGTGSVRGDFDSPIDFSGSSATLSWDWGRTRTGSDLKRIFVHAYDDADTLVYGLQMRDSQIYETTDGTSYLTTGIPASNPGGGDVGAGNYDPALLGSISLEFNPGGTDPTVVQINGSIASSLSLTATRIKYIVAGISLNNENAGGLFDNFVADGTPGGAVVPTSITCNPANIFSGDSTDLTITFDPAATSAELSNSTDATVDDLMAIDSGDSTPNDGIVVVSKSPSADTTYTVTVSGGSDPGAAMTSVTLLSIPSGQLTILPDSTPGGAFLGNAANASYTRVTDPSATPASFTRGQTFTAPDTGDANYEWGLTAITLQMRGDNAGVSVPSTGSNPMNLKIFTWGDVQGVNPGTEIYNKSSDFPLNVANGEEVTFFLGETVPLIENANYGFLLSWDTAAGNDVFLAIAANSGSTYDGGVLWIGNENSVRTDQDLTFTLHGAAQPGSPPVAPKITSITADDATPPNITLMVSGAPNTTYDVKASLTLADGFPDFVGTVTTDGSGVATFGPFDGVGGSEFYRLETQP